jgi:hypothetical protein
MRIYIGDLGTLYINVCMYIYIREREYATAIYYCACIRGGHILMCMCIYMRFGQALYINVCIYIGNLGKLYDAIRQREQ